MGIRLILVMVVTALFYAPLAAQKVTTFEQAKGESARSKKPILLQFVHEGCDHCVEAERQQKTDTSVQRALHRVVHLILDVNVGEGETLADAYRVSVYYPAFIITNSAGDEIHRWTGYSPEPGSFVGEIDRGLKDLTPIKDRVARQKSNPTYLGATYLAKYYTDRGENLKAVEYYRQAMKLAPNADFNLQIFKNLADACWKDEISFDEVLPAADAVIKAKRAFPYSIAEVARLMARLGREKNQIDRITPYLQSGLDATANSENERLVEARRELMADFTLHVKADTVKAIQIKKAAMGQGWENDLEKFFQFSRWCLERRINLDEAEKLARKAIDLAQPGKYRGKAYATVGEICAAGSKTSEAIKATRMAIQEDPDNEAYHRQLKELSAAPNE